tara:strand:- start:376 stop:555 length:180 start_codon:yes stop_codon:yes gene_type:complete
MGKSWKRFRLRQKQSSSAAPEVVETTPKATPKTKPKTKPEATSKEKKPKKKSWFKKSDK